jgi:uncharacterized repeat protein (TIGR01451 family)
MKNSLRLLAVVIALHINAHSANSQNFQIQKFSIKQYGPGDALVVNHEGEILLGSYDGVLKYNGTAFVPLYNSSNGLRGDSVRCMVEDPTGRLWIETEHGISVKTSNGWKHYKSYNWFDNYTIVRSQGGEAWMKHFVWNSESSFIARYNGIDSAVYSTEPPINYITKGPDQQYYGIGEFFCKLNPSGWDLDLSKLDVPVWNNGAIGADANNTLYIGGTDGFWRMKTEDEKFTWIENPFFASKYIARIESDLYGRTFFLLDHQEVIMLEDGVFQKLDLLFDGEWSSYNNMKVDKDGSVYLASSELVNDEWYQVVTKITFENNTFHPVSGILFNDINGDALQNNNEPGVPNHMMKIMPGSRFAITNADGSFTFNALDGQNTLSWIEKQFWQAGSTPTSYTFNFPDEVDVFRIGIQSDPVRDLSVTVNGAAVRPGFVAHYYLTVKNEGSTTESPVVSLQYDSDLTFVNSSITPTSHTDNVLIWSFPSLPSFNIKQVGVDFQTPVGTPLGTDIFTEATVAELDGEDDVDDNIDSLHQEVTGSFDPNDKLVREGVFEEKYVKIGSYLTYTIRFQNSGTDTAFTVRVNDVIDSYFDLSTFEVLSSSHPMKTSFNNREINFLFENILLPDSTRDEPKSHGYIKYKIKNVSGIANNTDVTNTADIYFDFNAPVVTNTVSNRYVIKVPDGRVESIEGNEAYLSNIVYPNPSSGVVKIDEKYVGKYETATLISLTGKVLAQSPIQYRTISFENIPTGLYLVRFQGRNKTAVGKLMIISDH